ncbi:SphA family protein [Occallatibacter riparius]|uniref:Transporter n=1 Tax=Occallatibacter riparius TaxID=1002689 RepID=A0A9J7BL95_9BACT|nr:transporter [Occallatibacter riparius]UWZ83403.1 transporter [Occallatibacter riparius]
MHVNGRACTALLFLSLTLLLPGSAQQKGQYLPGQFGLNAGVMPEPGVSYANISVNYFAEQLKDANGDVTASTGSYNLWAVENLFFYKPDKKLLGGNWVLLAIAPTAANGSVTEENLGLQAGGFGIADIFIQPLTLSWKLPRADVWVGDGFVAPTGRYSPGASDNIGSGYWGNQVLSGTTAYLTKNKGTSASLFTDWEVHGSKVTSDRFQETPGQTFTMEWGLGQVLPLDKQLKKLMQVGMVGYDQWQTSSNSGVLASGVPARTVPYYSAHALGLQANFIVPAKNVIFYFKFEPEYRALARVEGRTFAFGGSYTFRIPKPEMSLHSTAGSGASSANQ